MWDRDPSAAGGNAVGGWSAEGRVSHECAAGGRASGRRRLTRRRIVAAVALGVAAAAPLLFVVLWNGGSLLAFFSDAERVRSWVESLGVVAPAAMASVVAVQVIVAVLPGEPLELAAGYAFGAWDGTLCCMAGGALGTLVVVALVRTGGARVVELFFSREKISWVSWLRESRRFEALLFGVFLIPGTPKDVLTYVAGLTECPARRIVGITTVGRIPSIVSSTFAAHFAAQGAWGATIAVAALTLVLAVAGAAAYAALARRGKDAGRRR